MSAFECGAEIGVRLDAAEEDRMIGGGAELVHVEGWAVGQLADLAHVHRDAQFTAGAGFGDAERRQHFALPFGGGAAV